jgi:23S rRNA (guanosine2251-2'-O)-methyltransferase
MIVYGKQILFYILDKHPEIINEIYLTKEINKKLFLRLTKLDKKIIRPDNMKAQSLARGGNHQGFLLDIKEYEYCNLQTIKKQNFILILDGLTDIGNIGAIVRTSYALGVDAIVISGLKNLNSTSIIRTSSGAMLDIPIALICNSLDIANELKQVGFKLFGASMDGMEINKFIDSNKLLKERIALFLGNENLGLSKKTIMKLDQKITISMYNDFDSLNVSVASGILIHSLKQFT